MRLRFALLSLLLAGPAIAGAKDGVFTSAAHKARFKVPPADFKLRAKNFKLGIPGVLAEFENRDGGMAGVLLPAVGDWKAKELVKARGAQIEKNAGNCTWESEEKVDRPGDWFRAEFTVEMRDSELRYVDFAVARESGGLELLVWCSEAEIDKRRDVLEQILASLELGDFAEEGDDPTEDVTPPVDRKPPEGASWASAGGSVSILKPEGWVQRTADFVYGDANAVVEFQGGDNAFAYIASVADPTPSKDYAAAMMSRFESTWEAFKAIGRTEGDGAIRHDFRGKINGAMTRFSLVFFSAEDRNWYLAAYAGSTEWRKAAPGIEALIATLRCDGKAVGASVKTGGGTADPGDGTDPGDAGGADVTIPNPWNGFGKGSTAKHRMVSVASGVNSEMETIATLVEFDGESYTVKTDIVMNGTTLAGEPQKILLKQKSAGGESPKTESGEETIRVPRGEFACRWTRTETKDGWSKVWMCDKVPGGMVKMESQFAGASSMAELLDFDGK